MHALYKQPLGPELDVFGCTRKSDRTTPIL